MINFERKFLLSVLLPGNRINYCSETKKVLTNASALVNPNFLHTLTEKNVVHNKCVIKHEFSICLKQEYNCV